VANSHMEPNNSIREADYNANSNNPVHHRESRPNLAACSNVEEPPLRLLPARA